MLNKTSDSLFQLIKSLTKSEKKNFKLYATRNSSKTELRTVALFDVLEKMNEYDETLLLKKFSDLPKQQLYNIKTRLYRQVLLSLRLIKDEGNIDIQLHEQMDHARILYNKGLYLQSLKILDTLKGFAKNYGQLSYLQQALFFEKKIEGLHITRSIHNRADQLAAESDDVNERLSTISHLSNLSLQLYSRYIQNGHARNLKDEEEIKNFFAQALSQKKAHNDDFYENLYLYQSYCWYAFILQDFFLYYRYTQKWVNLFDSFPHMIEVESTHYLKGLHNLLESHFYLSNHRGLDETLQKLEDLCELDSIKNNENNLIQGFVYLTTARINKHFMQGTFTQGLKIVPGIMSQLQEYSLYMDSHRVLIFYYKIASLYFGSGDSETCIDYLQKIINWKTDLRIDLQCYARLLHLIAHYELGNDELLEYLSKSVYRLMGKMENLSVVEEEIFNFLKRAFHIPPRQLENEFRILLATLRQQKEVHKKTRAFTYLDIISWLESKIERTPVQDVIRRNYLEQVKHK